MTASSYTPDLGGGISETTSFCCDGKKGTFADVETKCQVNCSILCIPTRNAHLLNLSLRVAINLHVFRSFTSAQDGPKQASSVRPARHTASIKNVASGGTQCLADLRTINAANFLSRRHNSRRFDCLASISRTSIACGRDFSSIHDKIIEAF